MNLRGRPVMIGGGGNFRNEFIFSREPLPYKFFFLGKASQNLFFLRQSLSKFISWGVPLKIYFFLESASQNLFFPGKCLSKFIFSWRVPLKIYFFLEKGLRNFFSLDFLRPYPQIINGRPLLTSFIHYLEVTQKFQK